MNASAHRWSTMRYMRQIFAYRPLSFAINVLLWTLFHGIPLLFGLLTRAIFDSLSQGAAAATSPWSLLVLLALSYGSRQGVFWIAFQHFSHYYLFIKAFLRRNLMQHLMVAAGSRVLPESPSEAVSRFRDDVDDITNYTESYLDLSGFLIYGLLGAALLFATDPLIAAVVVAPLAVMALVVERLAPLIRTYRRRMREATARVTSFIGETLAAVQAVKVAAREAPIAARMAQLGEERRQRALADVLLSEMVRSLSANLVNLAVGGVLLLAAARMRTGEFSVGDLALFMVVLPRLTHVLEFAAGMMTEHRRARVAFDRMENLMVDAPPGQAVQHSPLDLEGPLAPFAGVSGLHQPLETLELRSLSYEYPTGGGIFQVSFSLKKGDFVVITGRIGAGKTTLLRVLQGLLPAHSGQILWNGQPVADPASFFRPPHSAYTAQVPRLFSETLSQNVLLGDPEGPQLDQALELAVLTPDLERLERGRQTLVGTRGVRLSGGQVQRTSAARLFTRNADLLIFDDLSSALDVATEKQLWEGLFSQREATCLVVSHRRVALRRASLIVVMKEGQVEAQGSLEDLLQRSPEMRRLWDEEAEEEV